MICLPADPAARYAEALLARAGHLPLGVCGAPHQLVGVAEIDAGVLALASIGELTGWCLPGDGIDRPLMRPRESRVAGPR
jgi:hypothetical protein